MLSVYVVDLGLFYNMVPEKIVAQQEILICMKEKVGIHQFI